MHTFPEKHAHLPREGREPILEKGAHHPRESCGPNREGWDLSEDGAEPSEDCRSLPVDRCHVAAFESGLETREYAITRRGGGRGFVVVEQASLPAPGGRPRPSGVVCAGLGMLTETTAGRGCPSGAGGTPALHAHAVRRLRIRPITSSIEKKPGPKARTMRETRRKRNGAALVKAS